MRRHNRIARRPFVVRFTMADRFLASGQRLRVAEPATATTFRLQYAAKWQQATIGGAR